MARKKRRGQRRKRVTFYSRTGRCKRKKVSFMVRVRPKRRQAELAWFRQLSPVGIPKIHETRRSFRVRLHKPTKKRYGRFRTIPLGREGLTGVIGIRKGKHRKRGRPRKGRRGVSELQSIIVPREINGLYARKIARRVKRRKRRRR